MKKGGGRTVGEWMAAADATGDERRKLEALAGNLAERLDGCEDDRTYTSLARQYRETVRALAELEDGDDDDDAISLIISRRRPAGQAGADRSRVAEV